MVRPLGHPADMPEGNSRVTEMSEWSGGSEDKGLHSESGILGLFATHWLSCCEGL